MPRAARTYRLTEFGRTVTAIAAEHGFVNRAQLLRHLEEHGHAFNTETVGAWLSGRNPVNRAFTRALKESLPLTNDQYRRLAYAFMDGQDA